MAWSTFSRGMSAPDWSMAWHWSLERLAVKALFPPFLFGIYSYRRFIYFLVLIFNLNISLTAFCVHPQGTILEVIDTFCH